MDIGATGKLRDIAQKRFADSCSKDRNTEIGEYAPAHALGGVTRCNMTDLMRQHSGKLCFVVSERH